MHDQDSDSEFLFHTSCPACGSSDANSVYSDGHTYCFACSTHTQGDSGQAPTTPKRHKTVKNLIPAAEQEFVALRSRGITEETCRRWGYGVAHQASGPVHVANYRTTEGELVGQKIRTTDKDFSVLGAKHLPLFGCHLWGKGRKLVVTEGECLPEGSQVLTPEGWVAIEKLEDQPVAQWNAGRLSFVTPLAYIKKPFDGELVRYEQRGYVSLTTPGHNMVFVSKKRGPYKATAETGPRSTADRLPRTGRLSGLGTGLSKAQIQLAIAVSADATIDQRVNGSRYARFAFKKDRKIDRLRGILKALGIKASDTDVANGYRSICFGLPDWVPGRFLPMGWLGSATLEERLFILEELLYWDGNSVPNRAMTEYSSKYAQNAEFVQTLAHTAGIVSTIINRSNPYGEWLKVTIQWNKEDNTCQYLRKHRTLVPYSGTVHCVTVPSGALLVRQEGKIHVTGNCDALAVSQVQDHKWPVVSIPNGADGAVKAIKRNMEYVQQFDEVVLMFDNDDPGRDAAEDVGLLLPPGTCKIATLPYKDPCECLKHNEGQAIIRAIWNAKDFRPDGVVSGTELRERTLNASHKVGLPYPYACLNGPTCGIHKGKVVVVTAGTGIGKSTLTREIAYDLSMRHQQSVGMLMLEEGVEETALSLCGIHVSLPLLKDRSGISDADLGKAFDDAVGNGRIYLYDHWGSKAVNAILQRIRYMHHGCGCDYFILDHISILVAALDDKDGRIDERKMIDMGMTELRTLAEELGITIFVVSHLSRSKDSKHEEGGQISLRDLRGSHAIAQVADLILALERNQQADAGSDDHDVSRIRILKNRLTGETGLVGELQYDKATGRLTERDAAGGYFQAAPKTDAAGDFTPAKSDDEPSPAADEFFGSGPVEDWREEAQEGHEAAQKEERPKTTAEEIEEGDAPSETAENGSDPKPVDVSEALDLDWLL